MEIPDSISNIAESVPADSFNSLAVIKNLNVGSIIEYLKHNTQSSDYSNIEEGLAYYKTDTQTDVSVIKNFLLLYSDSLKKEVTGSNITDESKPIITTVINDAIKSITLSMDVLSNITTNLNKQKNLLDAKRISFIMLGYAINIIKRYSNN